MREGGRDGEEGIHSPISHTLAEVPPPPARCVWVCVGVCVLRRTQAEDIELSTISVAVPSARCICSRRIISHHPDRLLQLNNAQRSQPHDECVLANVLATSASDITAVVVLVHVM